MAQSWHRQEIQAHDGATGRERSADSPRSRRDRTKGTRGAVRDDVRLREVPVSERVPFLRARIGLGGSRMLRPYFDATSQSSDADFAAIAPEHAVFKLERF